MFSTKDRPVAHVKLKTQAVSFDKAYSNMTYQVKKRGHKVKKFSTDFYLYSSEDITRKRIGKALDNKGFNTIDKDDVKDKLKDIYYRIISE